MFGLPERPQEQIAYLGDLLIHFCSRPLRRINGGQDLHPNGPGLKQEVAFGGDIPRVVNDHWNNGDAHLHCHVEATFFKGGKFAGWRAGALRGNHEGLAFITHGVHERRHRLNGFIPVGAIDENHPRRAHGLSNQWHPLDLFLAYRHHVTAHQACHDGNVCLALVVKHKYRGPVAPEVFLALDVHIQSNEGAAGIGEQGDGKIEGISLRSCERIDRQRRRDTADH